MAAILDNGGCQADEPDRDARESLRTRREPAGGKQPRPDPARGHGRGPGSREIRRDRLGTRPRRPGGRDERIRPPHPGGQSEAGGGLRAPGRADRASPDADPGRAALLEALRTGGRTARRSESCGASGRPASRRSNRLADSWDAPAPDPPQGSERACGAALPDQLGKSGGQWSGRDAVKRVAYPPVGQVPCCVHVPCTRTRPFLQLV